MAGDASGRRYFRGDEGVLVVYPRDMIGVMDHFLYWHRKYRAAGLPVPEVIQVDRQAGTVRVQDLGDCHGTDYLAGLSLADAVSFVSGIHRWTDRIRGMADGECEHRLPPVPVADELAFFLQQGRGLVLEDRDLSWLEGLCATVLEKLRDLPLALAHRDFHLRNVLVHEGQAYLIDFQDTRLAPVHYDRVSLLFDNYADLGPIRRQVWPDLDHPALRWVALQRGLKTMGTFCYFGFKAGKSWFRPSLAVAAGHVSDHLLCLGRKREADAWERVRERSLALTHAPE